MACMPAAAPEGGSRCMEGGDTDEGANRKEEEEGGSEAEAVEGEGVVVAADVVRLTMNEAAGWRAWLWWPS